MKRRKKKLMKKLQKSVRLSPYIHPQKYKIKLKPDMETFTFSGEETIDLLLEKPTKEITLHALELSITDAKFASKSKTTQATISYDKEAETATLAFPKFLPKGQGKFHITFLGIINDKMIGFYRSQYELNGKTHHMATTQFESTHARRAFPCFDEPAKKAVFEVSLEVPKESTVIANTIETEVWEHTAGYKIVSFAPTPKMSTYLLAFIVGQFEHIETKTPEGTTVRVFVTPGKKKQAEFALEVAAKTLSFFHKYFGIPYPLPVMDLIAIPDFAAGAMENWGAVTYRETALLVDSEHSSTASKQYVAIVITHELAHQWFGNLVTMEWWTHLWLNEGFASYIGYFAIDHIFPDWHIWTQFIALDHAQALEMDSLKHTHPIEVEVHHPDEINEIFDAVSYSKGASIIRMLASYLGEKDFARGLQHYLKKHSYANATTQDLWEALEKISKKPVKRIMRDWTSKAGYPLVTVKEQGKNLHISQERFFLSPKSKKESKEETTWAIPLSIATSSAKNSKTVLLTKKSMQVPLHSAGYLKVNPKEVGFFRVAYPPKYLQRLQGPIAKKIVSAEDRFGIIRDLFALSKSGEIPTTEALALLPAYKDEEEYIVWVEIATQLRELANLLAYEPFYEDLEKYNRSILSKITKQVGWEKNPKESHSQTLLRSVVLYSFGSYGDADTIKKAQTMLAEHIKGKQILPSDLRGVIYNLSAQNGDEETYKQILQLYKKETLHEEKDRLLRALGLFKNKQLLKKTLDLALSEHVRSQDAFRVIHIVWSNPKGRYLAWEFVQKKWDIILERFSKSHLIQRFVQPASTLTRREDAAAVKAFFKKNKAPSAKRTIAQVIEQIILQAEWFTRDKDKIHSFLRRSNSQ